VITRGGVKYIDRADAPLEEIKPPKLRVNPNHARRTTRNWYQEQENCAIAICGAGEHNCRREHVGSMM
jgi:hypothetical protein